MTRLAVYIPAEVSDIASKDMMGMLDPTEDYVISEHKVKGKEKKLDNGKEVKRISDKVVILEICSRTRNNFEDVFIGLYPEINYVVSGEELEEEDMRYVEENDEVISNDSDSSPENEDDDLFSILEEAY